MMIHLNMGILLFLIMFIDHLLYIRHGPNPSKNVNYKIPYDSVLKKIKIFFKLRILVQKPLS